ncbi:hypothetical protein AURDEDRAFT_110983 [Auricularia subglabra TFB-10046 SS5]|nr:hypothetical protein AURDEDRAFT_110983 [Auricularia subglabra TFB-10046 SS5]
MSSDLKQATAGFDLLFVDDLNGAKERFSEAQSPFHLMGAGVCTFIQAALGMEADLLAEASKCLAAADAGAKAQAAVAKYQLAASRFGVGFEWEVLRADAAVMTGLTQAIGETYMGYLNCLYSLNSAHSRFSKLYKAVFPTGLDQYATPATSEAPSRNVSSLDVSSPTSATLTVPQLKTSRSGIWGRWGSSAPAAPVQPQAFDAELSEMIIAGTAFGYGVFNLVFSLLPARAKSIVGFFGFTGDLQTALHALAVAAARDDVHAVFARLTLMSYDGGVLLLSGWQADDAHIKKQYAAMVDASFAKYPSGSLWSLHKAKLLRFDGNFADAVTLLQERLQHDPSRSFVQADVILMYDLAWALFALRRYREAGDAFIKLKELNKWSPATYNCLAAGCYISAGDKTLAQSLLDAIPELFENKKNGRELPMEGFIRMKLATYRAKKAKRTNDPESKESFLDEIVINPVHELGLFLNAHSRMKREDAEVFIREWLALTPRPTIQSPVQLLTNGDATAGESQRQGNDLILPEEQASRSLLLGALHSVARYWVAGREFLVDAARVAKDCDCKWVSVVAYYELAVLELHEADERLGQASQQSQEWLDTIARVEKNLEASVSFSSKSVEMSSRMESRVNMLRHELDAKRKTLQ